MKTAISTDNGQVAEHFGRCPEFTIVEVAGGKLVKKEVIPNPGHEPGFLPIFLRDKGVTCIVAGGMGARAQGLFAEQKIDTVLGTSGSVADVIQAIIADTLASGVSRCQPGAGRGYGVEKSVCDHSHEGEQ